METHAQESGVEAISPSRLTEGLISRNELRRLLKQSPSDRNPLRQRRLLPAPTIIDPNVRPTGFQEEPPSAAAVTEAPKSVPQENEAADETSPAEPAPFFGPMPSNEMQNRWSVLDMVAEYSVDELKLEIDTRRSKIDSSLGIDDIAKNDQLMRLELAESAVQKAIQNVAGKDKFQNRIMALDESLERLRIASKETAMAPKLDDNMSVEAMGLQLRNLQAELGHEKSNLSRVQERIQQRDARMESIPSERLTYRNAMNDFHTELLQKQATGMAEMEELLSIRAHELAASTKVQMLDQEANWHDLSQEKLPLEKSIHQRKIQQLENEINTWNNRIAKRKQQELEKQILAARQKAFETHPALREFSLETSSLTQERAELAEKISGLQNEKLKVEKQKHDVDQQFERLSSYEDSLADGGNEESNAALIEVHRNLIRPWESMARIRSIESDLILIRGSKLKLREQHDLISNPTNFIREQLEIIEDEPVANTTLTAMAESAVESHREQLVALIGDNEEINGLLNEIKTSREDMLKQIARTRELVDTYALWVQSSEPLDMQVLQKSREGAEKFFDHDQWRDLGSSIIYRIQHRPWECALGLAGLMVAFVVGRRFQG
jgi:chromosome segregation ATPase